MNFESFLPSFSATVIGGGLLTLIFFLLREKVYKSIDLDGSWTYEQETTVSDYNPYKYMTVRYLALVARVDHKIYGTAEKDSEKERYKEWKGYNGKHRTQIKITGHIEKHYFSKDRICIHITEYGEKRESSTLHILQEEKHNELSGRFVSTIANQQGNVKWTRRSS